MDLVDHQTTEVGSVTRSVARNRIGGMSGTPINSTPKKATRNFKASSRKLAERSAKRLTAKQVLLTKYQKRTLAAFSKAQRAQPNNGNLAFVAPEFQETSLLIVKEMGSISTIVLRQLKTPIACCLVGIAFALLLGIIMSAIQPIFQPFCIIPGISGSKICSPPLSNIAGHNAQNEADIPTIVDKQSEMFERLLEAATGGSALSLEIKKAEMATKDLIVMVRISDLNCKDILATALTEFASDARTTGRGLQKLAAKVGGAVDQILAANEYALQSIKQNEPAPWPLTSMIPWKPQDIIHDTVARVLDGSMKVLSANLERLIAEAEHSRTNLVNLEEKLSTLHEIVARDDSTISKEKSELLEHLWTRLGGNRELLSNFDHHLAILKGLNVYRKQALIHVVAALEALHAMSEDMQDMRQRAAAPDLLGFQVSAEVYMKSIQMSMERLQEGRTRARGSRMNKNAPNRALFIY